MSSVRLNGSDRLCGYAKIMGIAETQNNYVFAFDVWSGGKNNCAAADLIPGAGRRIWGVLYDVPATFIPRDPAKSRPSLDAIEGEGKNYERVHIDLKYANGDSVPDPVITYLGLARTSGIQTSLDYVGHILSGLAEHPEIPADYVAYVRARILDNNSQLRLPG